jgi:hypothetical protein
MGAPRKLGAMTIYLDMCCLQRPLDDKSQLRVLIEAQAVLAILAHCELGKAKLISSDALVFENDRTPDVFRRGFATQAIAKAAVFVRTNDGIKQLAQSYVSAGIKPLDALHLASSIEGGAHYFCTCDDRLLKKARTMQTGGTKIVSPLELVTELQP